MAIIFHLLLQFLYNVMYTFVCQHPGSLFYQKILNGTSIKIVIILCNMLILMSPTALTQGPCCSQQNICNYHHANTHTICLYQHQSIPLVKENHIFNNFQQRYDINNRSNLKQISLLYLSIPHSFARSVIDMPFANYFQKITMKPLQIFVVILGLAVTPSLAQWRTGVSGTEKGNAGGRLCSFPFIYKGISYNECITLDNGNKPWCSMTSNYDTFQQWANCQVTLQASE